MEKFVQTFSIVARKLSLAIIPLCIIAILGILAITGTEVVLRGIRGKGIPDSIALATALMPITAFMALAGAQVYKRHIKVTLLTEHRSPRTQIILEIFGNFMGLLLVIAATIMGFRAFAISFHQGEYFSGSFLTIPAWPGKLMMPVGFMILALQLVADILQDAFLLKQRKGGQR